MLACEGYHGEQVALTFCTKKFQRPQWWTRYLLCLSGDTYEVRAGANWMKHPGSIHEMTFPIRNFWNLMQWNFSASIQMG